MSTSSTGADDQAEAPGDTAFDPFPFGAPAPGSPVAGAFPELFPAPQPPGPAEPYAASPEQFRPYANQAGPYSGPSGQPGPYAGPGAQPGAYADPYSTAQPGPYAGGPGNYGQHAAPPGYSAGRPAGYPGWTASVGKQTSNNGRAVAGLILGIISLALFFFTVFDVPLVVLGVVFSSLGLAAANRGEGRRRMALAGLICSLVAALVVAATLVFLVSRMRVCDRSYDRGTAHYNSCLIDLG